MLKQKQMGVCLLVEMQSVVTLASGPTLSSLVPSSGANLHQKTSPTLHNPFVLSQSASYLEMVFLSSERSLISILGELFFFTRCACIHVRYSVNMILFVCLSIYVLYLYSTGSETWVFFTVSCKVACRVVLLQSASPKKVTKMTGFHGKWTTAIAQTLEG